MINTAKELLSHFNHSNINPDLIEHIRRFDEKMNEYSNELKAREEVIQEGLQLFATYFRGLWD